jgi:hypothetical protein
MLSLARSWRIRSKATLTRSHQSHIRRTGSVLSQAHDTRRSACGMPIPPIPDISNRYISTVQSISGPNAFVVLSNGWVSTSNHCNLYWVPTSARKGLCDHKTLLVIGVRMDLSRFAVSSPAFQRYSQPCAITTQCRHPRPPHRSLELPASMPYADRTCTFDCCLHLSFRYSFSILWSLDYSDIFALQTPLEHPQNFNPLDFFLFTSIVWLRGAGR